MDFEDLSGVCNFDAIAPLVFGPIQQVVRLVEHVLRLHDAETAMLFCATRDNVRRLHASLVERGFSAVALSGEHSQNERNQALQALREQWPLATIDATARLTCPLSLPMWMTRSGKAMPGRAATLASTRHS